jgi:hypothetical protein
VEQSGRNRRQQLAKAATAEHVHDFDSNELATMTLAGN